MAQLLIVLFIAALIKVVLGFGEALLAMPLLTLMLGVQVATPLVGFLSLVLTAMILLRNRQNIDLNMTWRLVLASALGIPVGLLILHVIPAQVVTRFLGLLLIVYSLYALFQPRWMTFTHPAWGYGLGFFAGVLGSAYNVGGPPMVIYADAQHWQPEQYQGMLQSFFLPMTVLIVLSHALSGLWTPDVLLLFGLTLPIAVGAFFIGGYVSRRIPQAQFARLVRVGMIVLGIVLLARS